MLVFGFAVFVMCLIAVSARAAMDTNARFESHDKRQTAYLRFDGAEYSVILKVGNIGWTVAHRKGMKGVRFIDYQPLIWSKDDRSITFHVNKNGEDHKAVYSLETEKVTVY